MGIVSPGPEEREGELFRVGGQPRDGDDGPGEGGDGSGSGVVYELGTWLRQAAGELARRLERAGIEFDWVDGDLVVDQADEDRVDAYVEAVEELFDIPPEAMEPEGDLAFDLAHWTDAQRLEAERLVMESGLSFGWEYGTDLVVFERDVDVVSALLEGIEHPNALGAEEEGEEVGGELLSELFLAADKLRRDPGDGPSVQRLVAVLDAAQGGASPYGVDSGTWLRARALAETIRSRLSYGDLPITVQDTAQELRDLLHPLV